MVSGSLTYGVMVNRSFFFFLNRSKAMLTALLAVLRHSGAFS